MFNALLTDDSPSFRNALREVLIRHFPFMVILEAGDSQRAVALGAERQPQLVFMDIKLPDGNGLDLTRRLKASNPSAAVCIVTQRDIPEYRIAAKECGADHFIAKDESSEAAIVSLVEATISSRFRVLLVNHNTSLRHQVENFLEKHWPAMVIVEAAFEPTLSRTAGFQADVVILSEPFSKKGWASAREAIRQLRPDAGLIVITRSKEQSLDIPSPSHCKRFLIRRDDHFDQALISAMSSIIDAQIPRPE